VHEKKNSNQTIGSAMLADLHPRSPEHDNKSSGAPAPAAKETTATYHYWLWGLTTLSGAVALGLAAACVFGASRSGWSVGATVGLAVASLWGAHWEWVLRKEAKAKHEREVLKGQVIQALDQASRINDRSLRAAVRAQIALHSLGMTSTPLDTHSLLVDEADLHFRKRDARRQQEASALETSKAAERTNLVVGANGGPLEVPAAPPDITASEPKREGLPEENAPAQTANVSKG
jgi:hypothetical protein